MGDITQNTGEKEMIKKESLFSGLIVGGVIDIMVVIFLKVDIAQGWPAFFTTLLFMTGFFMIGPAMYTKIKNIFVGGVTGILFNFGQGIAIAYLAPFIGHVPSLLLTIGLICIIICTGGDVVPVVFNNYTFIYWMIAGAFGSANATFQGTLTLLGTLLLGGPVFIGLIIILMRFAKLLPPPLPKEIMVAQKEK